MKSITRLYLSKKKQRILSTIRRIDDARNGLVLNYRLKNANGNGPFPISHISIVGVIEDRDWNDLRLTAIAPWTEGDELICSASPAFGEPQACRTFIVAKHGIEKHAEEHYCPDTRTLVKILLTIQIPKRVTSYVMTLENASDPEICGQFVLRESTYGEMLHEGGMLVLSAEHDCSYPEWFEEHKASESELEEQRYASFDENPVFSIIVPLYKTPLAFFNDMVHSVIEQSYPYWQLVLVNASPEEEGLSAAAASIAEKEGRVTVVTLDKNLGITLNTNAGIEASVGDFICFFDHDDIIEPDILFEYAKAINEHPTTDVLYCDEDKLTSNGELQHPFFKPDYSPDLLNCHNYICHMLTIRASILAQFEPASSEMDGAQDYNCVLRASEKARHIHHVRKILYHWRINPTSVAGNAGNKPYAINAGKIALEQHFNRLGINALIELRELPFRYNAVYQLGGNPLVSIIIPSCNDHRLLEACISSIACKTSYANYEVFVVDCGTTDARTLAYYEAASSQDDRIRVVRPLEEGAPKHSIANRVLSYGAAKANGDYLVFLSRDSEIITPDWLSVMLGFFQRDEVGCVGARVMCADGTIFHAGIAIGENGAQYLNQNATMNMLNYFQLRDDVQNVSAVSPSCMMTPKDLFNELGGFDSSFMGEYQGIDYCLKARAAGKLIVYSPFSEIMRSEPYTQFDYCNPVKDTEEPEAIALLKKRWPSYWADGDPYYSVNFQKHGPGGRFYHLKRDYQLTVALGRHGLEYRQFNKKPIA